MSSDAITFTNPKSGVSADYPFEASKIFSLDLTEVDDSISVFPVLPVLPLAPQGDTPASFDTKGDLQPPQNAFSSPPRHSSTKGDVADFAAPSPNSKSYHSFPMSSAVVKVSPKVYLHTIPTAPPVARVFNKFGTITHAVCHPQNVHLDLPKDVPSFTFDGILVPSPVAKLSPITGLPPYVHPSHFDALNSPLTPNLA